MCVCMFCNSVGVLVMCNMYTSTLWLPWLRFFRAFSSVVRPRVKLAKTGHGPHSSKLVVICVVLLLFVLFCRYLCCSVAIVFYCCYLCCSVNICAVLMLLCCTVVICVVLSIFVLFCCYCVVLLLFVLFCHYLCCSVAIVLYCCYLCCSVIICAVLLLLYFTVVICVVLLLFMLFYLLFVCKCVLYHCHWVLTQLQLTNISISISNLHAV
jgi:hypothetical protein